MNNTSTLAVPRPSRERFLNGMALRRPMAGPARPAAVIGNRQVQGRVFWLFGRSGAGKTTLGLRLRESLLECDISVVYLDGDEMRATVCSDLDYQPAARLENHRRIAEMALVLTRQGMNVVVSTMAPEYSQRDLVARILGEKLAWFYVDAPLKVCMERDPKGIYQRALVGQIGQLLDYPFAPPRTQERENHIDTSLFDEESCYQRLLAMVERRLE